MCDDFSSSLENVYSFSQYLGVGRINPSLSASFTLHLETIYFKLGTNFLATMLIGYLN